MALRYFGKVGVLKSFGNNELYLIDYLLFWKFFWKNHDRR